MLARVLKGGKGRQTSRLERNCKLGCSFFFCLLRCTTEIKIVPRASLTISQGPFMGVIIFRLRELTV